MENPSNSFWAPEPGSVAKAEGRRDSAGGEVKPGWNDDLQLMELNCKDQRNSFPLSGYINVFFIQVTEGLQNQRVPPATSAQLTADPCQLPAWAPWAARAQQQIHSQLSFSGRDTNLSLCTVPVLISYKNFHYFFHLITPFVKPYWSWPTSFWNIFCGWQQRHRQHGNS